MSQPRKQAGRKSLWLALCVSTALVAAPIPALAQTATPLERFKQMLQSQGFSEMKVNRTWLGRVRIVARSKDARRELVFNPYSGEVLRDYIESEDDGDLTDGGSGGDTGDNGDNGDSGGGTGGDGGDGGGSGGNGGDGGGSGGGSGGGGGERAALDVRDYLTGGQGPAIAFG